MKVSVHKIQLSGYKRAIIHLKDAFNAMLTLVFRLERLLPAEQTIRWAFCVMASGHMIRQC